MVSYVYATANAFYNKSKNNFTKTFNDYQKLRVTAETFIVERRYNVYLWKLSKSLK